MSNSRVLMPLMLLTLCGQTARGDVTPQSEWLRMIRDEVGVECAVELVKVGWVLDGNNGYHEEHWLLKSCTGDIEYAVSYYPPRYFPDRKSSYEFERIQPK